CLELADVKAVDADQLAGELGLDVALRASSPSGPPEPGRASLGPPSADERCEEDAACPEPQSRIRLGERGEAERVGGVGPARHHGGAARVRAAGEHASVSALRIHAEECPLDAVAYHEVPARVEREADQPAAEERAGADGAAAGGIRTARDDRP